MTRELSVPESAKLCDIVAVAVCAAIAGADSWGDIESFGNAKIDRFETFLELPNGIPSHDTFGRVFPIIDARSFQDIFVEWTKRVWEATQGQVAAIDGKTVRRSADKANGESHIHMAGAWATANVAALEQVKTDDRSNEITAPPQTAQDAGNQRLRCDHRRHGAPEEDRAPGRQTGRGLRFGGQEESAATVGRHSRRFRIRRADEVRHYGHDVFATVNKGHGRVERRRRLGDLRPVGGAWRLSGRERAWDLEYL